MRALKIASLVLVTAVASYLRLHQIDVLPPGETYDPAYYGVDALAILDGKWPIFFETNFGREPMFSYIVAACVALLGVGSPAIHVASAIVGITTIPATHLAADLLFSEEGKLLRNLAAPVASLALAVSRWHLHWSRYGVRAILTPLFAALTVYLLWRAVQRRRWQAYVPCGGALGMAMYTYQASRLLPVLVITGLAYAVMSRRLTKREGLLGLGVVAAVASLLALPLGVYFAAHPGAFTERIDQVFVLGEGGERAPWPSLAAGLRRTVLVFSFEGDERPTINLPGRPALDPFLSVAFAAGLLISVFRIRRPSSFLLLAWLGVMCVPGVMAGYGPTAKRIIGSLPAVMMLIAIGLLYPAGAAQRLLSRAEGWRSSAAQGALFAAWAAVLLGGMAYSAAATYRAYFVTWGQDPALFTHFEAGLAAIGQYVADLPAGERVYVSPVYVGHPSIRYNSREREGIKGYHGEYCIVLPVASERATTYIVVPGEDTDSLARLADYLPNGAIVAAGPLHYGEPYFLAYRVPAHTAPRVEPAHVVDWSWGNQISLLGYDLAANEGQTELSIRLYYQAAQGMQTDYSVSVQLIGPSATGAENQVLSQADSEPCRQYRPTSSWATDELLVDTFTLALPQDWVGGATYEVIVAIYDWRTMVRLPLTEPEEQLISDHAVLLEWVAADE